MTTIKALRILTLAVILAAGSALRAEALPIVSFQGTTSGWVNGQNVQLDIVVTGLGEATGGLNIDVQFDDTTLAPQGLGYTINPITFVDVNNGLDLSGGVVGNMINLNFTSFESLASLIAAQGPFPTGNLVLASLFFTATADDQGSGGFTFHTVDLSNNEGTALLPVCIEGQPCPTVPEPATLALFGAALAAFGVRRFRRV